MARPAKGKVKVHYHKIAESTDPAWARWYDGGNPEGLVVPITGPAGTTAAARAAEYKKIFARLNTQRRKYRQGLMARRARELERQKHNDTNDLPSYGKPIYRHRDIAQMLTAEFDQEISTTQAGRLININEIVFTRWSTTDTHSITHPAAPRRKSD